jgi:hypothetical protein
VVLVEVVTESSVGTADGDGDGGQVGDGDGGQVGGSGGEEVSSMGVASSCSSSLSPSSLHSSAFLNARTKNGTASTPLATASSRQENLTPERVFQMKVNTNWRRE